MQEGLEPPSIKYLGKSAEQAEKPFLLTKNAIPSPPPLVLTPGGHLKPPTALRIRPPTYLTAAKQAVEDASKSDANRGTVVKEQDTVEPTLGKSVHALEGRGLNCGPPRPDRHSPGDSRRNVRNVVDHLGGLVLRR